MTFSFKTLIGCALFIASASCKAQYNFRRHHARVSSSLATCHKTSTDAELRATWDLYHPNWKQQSVKNLKHSSELSSSHLQNMRRVCQAIKETNDKNFATHQSFHADLNPHVVMEWPPKLTMPPRADGYKPTQRSILKKRKLKKRLQDVNIDWTNHTIQGTSITNWITPVKDQGQFGTCWTFSSVGAIESAVLISSLGKINVSISELNIIQGVEKFVDQTVTCNTGSQPELAMQFMNKYGSRLESQFPYVQSQYSCAKSPSSSFFTGSFLGVQTIGTAYAWSEGVAGVGSLLTQPQVIGMHASYNEFYLYGGGVLVENNDCLQPADHAVLLVGYNSNYLKIKNSWGTSWGEKGFVRFATNTVNRDGPCNILQLMRAPPMKFNYGILNGGSNNANAITTISSPSSTTFFSTLSSTSPSASSTTVQSTVFIISSQSIVAVISTQTPNSTLNSTSTLFRTPVSSSQSTSTVHHHKHHRFWHW